HKHASANQPGAA
ncbi:unnamed protein product, partial [Allacma fusca]